MKNEEIITRSAEQLGAALERSRKKKGETQQSLGTKAGLRQGTISKVESGAKNTEIATIYSICAALGLEILIRPRSQSKAQELLDLFKDK